MSMALWLLTSTAWAAVPATVPVQGALTSTGGGPVADGSYDVTFRFFKAEQFGDPLWTEGPVKLTVQNGLFAYALGQKTALDAKVLESLGAAWLSVQVGGEPELPRKALQSVPFSLRTSLAEGLSCSGCVTLAHLSDEVLAKFAQSSQLAKSAFSGDYQDLKNTPNLAKVALSGAYADLAGAPALAQVALSGAYGDLQGTPVLAKVAASGAYADLTGTPKLADVAATGSYSDLANKPTLPKLGAGCGTGLVMTGLNADGSYACAANAAVLPNDAIAAVSNGMLTVNFDEVVPGKTALAIPDNNPVGVSDTLTFPDVGIAQAITVQVDLTNSDISKVTVKLIDPNNAEYLLYDKGKVGAGLKASYPNPDAVVEGDLGKWVGKSPAGKWSLTVIDTGFVNNKTDGQVNAWSVSVKTVSGQKVAANGGFQFKSYTKDPVICAPNQFGFTYVNSADKTLRVCNGKDFFPLYLGVVGSQDNPGASCKDILTKMPASKDGAYWINPLGSGAYQVWCDMTTDGGGWTLAAKMDGSKNTWAYDAALWTDGNTLNPNVVDLAQNEAKYAAFYSMAFTQFRVGMQVGNASQSLTWSKAANSLKDLFSGGAVGTGFGRNAWKALVPNSSAQPNCNTEGVNVSCGSRKVRFGLLTNQENDCQSCDSYLGFGHSGEGGCDGVGSGFVGCMASCSADNGSKNINGFGWFWVR
jgi:subtilisin-like proprotein convertase family protein